MSDTPTTQEIGEALFGPRWQSELARALEMSDRHIRRLTSGEAQLTPGILGDIRKIAIARGQAIADLIERLPKE